MVEPSAAEGLEEELQQYPPLNFFYSHLHNAIKAELRSLSLWVGNLEQAAGAQEGGLLPKLMELRERYRFLEQVHKYHSSVEDEVVYPALDAKVKNVTVAYRVEHQDEELLLEQLAQLISAAMTQGGTQQTETIRGLICKVEEIHRTLKKHLAKEEEQLLPLLLQHFTFAEQAGLVAQFLYCIPLTKVEQVLAWLKPQVPQVEQQQLLQHIRGVVPDDLLVQLLTLWLQPPVGLNEPGAPALPGTCTAVAQPSATRMEGLPLSATADVTHPQAWAPCGEDCPEQSCQLAPQVPGSAQPPATCSRPPLKEIIHIHRTICCALEEFAVETRGLQQRSDVTALQLGSLVDRHRFLRSVCMFHTISEEEVMYPEVRRLSASDPLLAAPGSEGADASAACIQCEREHESEVSAMEDLGRLLADVRAFARRGRKEVTQMLAKLSSTAEQVLASISHHMAREEVEVFPLLERHLCVHSQRAMVWRTLTAMPLRLLERVLPWVTATLNEGDTRELRNNIRLGSPEPDSALVQLLLRWADRGRFGAAKAAAEARDAGVAGVAQQVCSAQATPHVGPPAGAPEAVEGSGLVGEYMAGGSGELLSVVPGSFIKLSGSSPQVAVGEYGALEPHSKRQRVGQQVLVCSSPLLGPQEGWETAGPPAKQWSLDGQPWPAQDPLVLQRSGSSPEPFGTALGAEAAGAVAGVPQPPGGGLVHGGSTSLSLTEHQYSRGCSPMEASTCLYAPATASTVPAAPVVAPVTGRTSPHQDAAAAAAGRNPFHPIDHIFQFHQALRQELRQLEADALRVERAVMGHIQELGAVAVPVVNAARCTSSQDAVTGLPHCPAHQQGPQQQQQQPGTLGSPRCSGMAEAVGSGREELAAGPDDAPGGSSKASAGGQDGAEVCGSPARVDALAPQRCPTPAGPVGITSQDIPERCGTPAFSTLSNASAAGGGGADGAAAGAPSTSRRGVTGATASATTTSYLNRLPKRVAAAVQALDGRFQFLWGIYRAHSRSEDEIVFPALESKQALRNVSHAYTLDHQQEEQLFLDLEQVMDALRRCDGDLQEARESALAVRRMCAAVRASLETHIRAEEAELWPLFTEHFSLEEQQYLVGVIIGRTGAQVLQTLLPWISESFSLEEKELMMGSLRQATKNTMFDQWLEAVSHQPPAAAAAIAAAAGEAAAHAGPSHAGACGACGAGEHPSHLPGGGLEAGQMHGAPSGRLSGPGQAGSGMARDSLPDPELARFLMDNGGDTPMSATPLTAGSIPGVILGGKTAGVVMQLASSSGAVAAAGAGEGAAVDGAGVGADGAQPGMDTASESGASHGIDGAPAVASGATVEVSAFRPGWEDIFRMNQKQLEAAVMRVSADPHLEPGRKAYLIQNIMVSKYIVAQQKRMQKELQEAEDGEGSGVGGGGLLAGLPWSGAVLDGAGAQAGAGGTQLAGVEGALASPRCRRTFHDVAQGTLGCKHYRRKAQLVAPCCQRVFTCRLCHDEAVTHRMDRYAVTDMVCMECGVQQPVAGSCNTCSAKLARYYCNICHLFDDEPGQQIYHCPFCNVCRRGRGLGIDFFHCMSCNACMSLSVFKTHTCRERAMESNCPVCSEYLFDSADPIKELPCGHLLHSRCFAEYTRYNYTCPLCSKSVGDMSVYFQMLDSLLASERLPPEYAGRMQQILCHDCGKTGFARFHFAYHACPHCRSYNTRVM